MPEPLTLMIAAAILDATVGLVTDQTLGEWLRSFRAGNRQSKAFEGALERAFAEFKARHAELAASLFDERFVTEVAAPELAKLLTGSLDPDAQHIAAGYAKQFGQAAPDVSAAIVDLIGCVRRALASEPALSELWHRRQASETHELVTTYLPQIHESIRQLSSGQASDAIRLEEERQAEESLGRILRLRAVPNYSARQEIAVLARRVLDGDLARLSNEARARVLYWAARLHAAEKATAEAGKHYKEDLLRLKPGSDTSIVDAWLSFHSDGVDVGLQHIRDSRTPDGRSVCFALLREGRGREIALEWFGSEKPAEDHFFTAFGWRSLAITLAEVGKWEEAAGYLATLKPHHVQECSDLPYVEGVINAALMLPKGVRHHALAMNIVDPQIDLREGPEVAAYRRRAFAKFEEASQVMTRLDQQERADAAEFWRDWVVLTDPDQRNAARSRIAQAMVEGQRAVDYVGLAVAFHVDFDAGPLERYLQQRERTVGLSPKELQAKLTLLRHKQPAKVLIGVLEDERQRLSEILEPRAVAYLMIDALVRDGQAMRAEEVLAENRASFDLDDFGRLNDLVQLTLGKDVRSSLEVRYKETGKYEDLKNLVGYLRSRQDWTALYPYLIELFEQERNGQNAILIAECVRHNQTDTDLLTFLEANSDLDHANPDLRSIRAWTLFRLGMLPEAQSLNENLLQVRGNDSDIRLDINLALQSGDWERFPAIVEREWEKREQLSPKRLLQLASIAAEAGPGRALQLVELAVAKAPDDPQILVDAGSLSIAIGHDGPAFAWIGKAAQLSEGGGRFRRLT